MQIFITTFTAVATLLFIGTLGFWMLSRRIIAGTVLGSLSVLAIDIALPSLTITGILTSFHPEKDIFWWTLPLWWAGFTVFAFMLTCICSFVSGKESRREFMVSLFFQNGIFFPIAILSQMFGINSSMLVDLFLFTLLYPAFFFNVAPLFFKKGLKVDFKRVFNPILIGTVAALVIRLLDLNLFIPAFAREGLRLVGSITIPLLMIVLGGNIYMDIKATTSIKYLETLTFVFMKNIVFPIATLIALILVKPSYSIALIIMLQAAVPPVTAIPIIAEREGGDRNIINQFMVASFLFSLISLPVMLMIFHRFFNP